MILEHSLPTTQKGIHQLFNGIPRSRIALENRGPLTLRKPAVPNFRTKRREPRSIIR